METVSAWFKGIRGRLLLLTFLPIVVLGVVSFLALDGISSLATNLETAGTVRAPMIRAMGEMDSARNAVFRWMWATYVNEGDLAGRQKTLERVKFELNRFDEAEKAYGQLLTDERMKSTFSKIESDWGKARGFVTESIGLLEKHTPKENNAARAVMTGQLRSALEPLGVGFAELRKMTSESIQAGVESTRATTRQLRAVTLGTCFGASLILLMISFFIASRLAKTLTRLTSEIASSGGEVGSASQQLSAASQQLSAGATEGAASLEETVASIEELSSMVKLNADHAKEAAALSQNGRGSAEQGEQEMKQLIGAMSEISQSSKRIEDIINVIDDIAFQTNILALNAAVEAARAGEQGKGFAVVAEAVRNLAQRSGGAAKEIATLIKDSVEKVDHGAKIAAASGAVLNNIVTAIKKVADLNNEIAAASQEQSTGLGQISKAMNQLDQATQGNAASAEQVAASSEEMSAQAKMLQNYVNDLGTIVHGQALDEPKTRPMHHSSSPTSKSVVPSRKKKLKYVAGGATPDPEEEIPFGSVDNRSKSLSGF